MGDELIDDMQLVGFSRNGGPTSMLDGSYNELLNSRPVILADDLNMTMMVGSQSKDWKYLRLKLEQSRNISPRDYSLMRNLPVPRPNEVYIYILVCV